MNDKRYAWTRMKPTKEGSGQWVKPYVYQVIVGESWGRVSNVLAEYDNMDDAVRMAAFHNIATEHDEG